MRETKKGDEKSPPCGYGSMGLCCSSCLLGPCRISPFERETAKGLCGDNADLIVAKNLLRLVALEGAGELKHLSGTIRKLRSSVSSRSTAKPTADGKLKEIAEKYGVGSRVTAKRFIDYLTEESERLLSPLSESERPSMLPASLYPEGPFPFIHRNVLLPNSLTSLIFDTLSQEQKESSTVEVILRQCLKTSMLKFILEELRRDMEYLTGGDRLSEIEREAIDVVDNLATNTFSTVVFLSRDDDLPEEFKSRTSEELRQTLNGIALLIPIGETSSLPSIGRRFFQKWSLSVSGVGAIVVAFSQSTASVLGALACGFTVVSYPTLPIHGSDVVEKFFCVDLKEKLGSVYLPPRAGEVLPLILEYLGRKV